MIAQEPADDPAVENGYRVINPEGGLSAGFDFGDYIFDDDCYHDAVEFACGGKNGGEVFLYQNGERQPGSFLFAWIVRSCDTCKNKALQDLSKCTSCLCSDGDYPDWQRR